MPATKEQIALTFMSLAFHYGFRRASVEDVARTLRISKKTIYEHFRSKEAMLEYGLELAALEQRRRVESLLTERTALGRLLQATGVALADARAGFAENPGVELIDPELQAQVNDRVYGPLVREMLEQGVAAGEFQVADVDMTSRFLQAIGLEAVLRIREDPETRPEEATAEAMRRLVTGAAAPAGGKKPGKKRGGKPGRKPGKK